jgi:hypothetical protein
MHIAEMLVKYNGFILIFSATGFLLSLFWYTLTERSKRSVYKSLKAKKNELFDEKVFFGDFDSPENPAVGDEDLKPIFNPEGEDLSPKSDEDHFIKFNDKVEFPILKKEVRDNLIMKSKKNDKSKKKVLSEKEQKKINDKQQVNELLDKIKLDIKNKKG